MWVKIIPLHNLPHFMVIKRERTLLLKRWISRNVFVAYSNMRGHYTHMKAL
jgi:hypothetical protein